MGRKVHVRIALKDWNALSNSATSSAEGSEHCVAKFTSVVRDWE